MTYLTTWTAETRPRLLEETTDPGRIAAVLAGIAVRFERWPLATGLPAGAGAEEILAAYRSGIDALTAAAGFALIDIAALHPTAAADWPEVAATARERFRAEHTHDDDEIRFFAAGSGVFYLHVDDRVQAVHCVAGDLIGVPKGTTHWFDMGVEPDFAAIRFFRAEDGWVGAFTGSDISARIPDFDTLARRAASAIQPAAQTPTAGRPAAGRPAAAS
jgi:1,2-dihydroxy-3-keto-5-methylthiopentene dioxygenase